MKILLSALIFASAPIAPAQIEPECPVLVDFTLHSSIGPIRIQNACLTAHSYADGLLVIEARDFLSQGIFKSGFEIWP